MFRNFADVQQPVGAREKFDESPELRQPHHFAKIRLADLRRRSDVAHHLQRRIATRAAGRENVHCAVFQHVNFHASSFDDRLDLLPARTDQIANLVRRNVQLVQPRCVSPNRRSDLPLRQYPSRSNISCRRQPPIPSRYPRKEPSSVRQRPSTPANLRKPWPSTTIRSIPKCRKLDASRKGTPPQVAANSVAHVLQAPRAQSRDAPARARTSLRPR